MKRNKEIWKVPLQITEWQHALLPRNTKILSIQVQNKIPCIWFMVDFDDTLSSIRETVKLQTVPTGESFSFSEDTHKFLGTYQVDGFVGHVFQVT